MMETGEPMRLMRQLLPACMLVLAMAGIVVAANTPSGTVITNTATVDFELSGVSQISVSGSTSFTVDNKVNVVVTRNADATAVSGSANQALSFLVTNLGNTTQRYALSIVSRVTDSFDMNNVRIYRDNGTTAGFWDAGDTLYVDAATFGDVVSGASLTVLVVADTPAAQTNGQTAVYDLVATTVDAGSPTVTAATGRAEQRRSRRGLRGHGRHRGGRRYRATGSIRHRATFTVSDVVVTVNKAVTVIDQFGGARPLPGATLRYTLTVSVIGQRQLPMASSSPIPFPPTRPTRPVPCA